MTLASYAVLNSLVATLLLATAAFFWYELFGGLLHQIAALGVVGWVLIAAILGVLLRPATVALRQRASTCATGPCVQRIRFRAERRWRVPRDHRLRDVRSSLNSTHEGSASSPAHSSASD